MKILIIGNRTHQFIYNYVRELKKSVLNDDELTIDILSYDSTTFHSSYDDIYDNVYSLKVPHIFNCIKLFRIIYQQFILRRYIQVLNNYDYIHIHYVENYLLRDSSFLLSHIRGKLIISIWGSDFLRRSKFKRKQLSLWLSKADKITIASTEVALIIQNYYSKLNISSKISVCKFGLRPLEYIITNKNIPKSNLLRDLKLPLSDIYISIGYNASKKQRHLDIIRNIENNESLIKYRDKITFILLLTYPENKKYIKEIKNLIANSHFRYVIIDDYLSDEIVAKFRLISDIFIQLQPTDMLSGSMLEYFCSKNIVITGSWLPYRYLEETGVFFCKIDNLFDISNSLYLILDNYHEYRIKCISNNDIITNEFLWTNVILNWIKVYDGIKNNL